jgi:predicted ATP-grasp superfamily ATP-dependent carboligase
MRSLVTALTRVGDENARETVDAATPQARATSWIVGYRTGIGVDLIIADPPHIERG